MRNLILLVHIIQFSCTNDFENEIQEHVMSPQFTRLVFHC